MHRGKLYDIILQGKTKIQIKSKQNCVETPKVQNKRFTVIPVYGMISEFNNRLKEIICHLEIVPSNRHDRRGAKLTTDPKSKNRKFLVHKKKL
jgi:hypothetical protein